MLTYATQAWVTSQKFLTAVHSTYATQMRLNIVVLSSSQQSLIDETTMVNLALMNKTISGNFLTLKVSNVIVATQLWVTS